MVRYEILILATPEITQDESKRLESELDKVIQADNGTMISFERWGKYRLTYPVKHNDYGVYFLARFEIEKLGELSTEIDSLFKVKLNDIVMRSMITRLDIDNPLNYQRPPSLEETPARDVSFLTDSLSGGRKRSRRDESLKSESSSIATSVTEKGIKKEAIAFSIEQKLADTTVETNTTVQHTKQNEEIETEEEDEQTHTIIATDEPALSMDAADKQEVITEPTQEVHHD